MKKSQLERSLQQLSALADSADSIAAWPAESWGKLIESGAHRWCIPAKYGGDELDPCSLLEGYEQLAGACLTTCFILSQRDSACRRLRDSLNEELCQHLLPPLAAGTAFATVGLSQLTTSRQHLGPSLRITLSADKVGLEGTIPWVTGAIRADHFVVGGVLDDGRQLLVVLPAKTPGVEIEPPLALMALEGSMTAQLQCRNVELDRRCLLAGPAERVMAAGRGGTGGVETSCLALGLAGAAIDYLHGESHRRPDLRDVTQRLEQSRQTTRKEMHSLVKRAYTPEEAAVLRSQANSLVLRATQAALTASKGTGFLRGHPAQRWARQALFFLVWSCPRPAAEATLDALVPPGETLSFSGDENSPAACE